jgi:hypothetical protein
MRLLPRLRIEDSAPSHKPANLLTCYPREAVANLLLLSKTNNRPFNTTATLLPLHFAPALTGQTTPV